MRPIKKKKCFKAHAEGPFSENKCKGLVWSILVELWLTYLVYGKKNFVVNNFKEAIVAFLIML